MLLLVQGFVTAS